MDGGGDVHAGLKRKSAQFSARVSEFDAGTHGTKKLIIGDVYEWVYETFADEDLTREYIRVANLRKITVTLGLSPCSTFLKAMIGSAIDKEPHDWIKGINPGTTWKPNRSWEKYGCVLDLLYASNFNPEQAKMFIAEFETLDALRKAAALALKRPPKTEPDADSEEQAPEPADQPQASKAAALPSLNTPPFLIGSSGVVRVVAEVEVIGDQTRVIRFVEP